MLTLRDIRAAAEGSGEALVHASEGRVFVGSLEVILNADGTVSVLSRLGAFKGTFGHVDSLFRLFSEQDEERSAK